MNTWLTSSLCTSIERGRSFTPSTGCCHLGGHLLILIVDVEFWGQAFCLQLSILAWPSQGCCSGLISPLSGQNLTSKKELIRLRFEMNGYCWKKHWEIDREYFCCSYSNSSAKLKLSSTGQKSQSEDCKWCAHHPLILRRNPVLARSCQSAQFCFARLEIGGKCVRGGAQDLGHSTWDKQCNDVCSV